MCCTSCGEAHVKRTYNGSYTRTLCLFHSLTHSLNHALLLLSPHCLFDSLLSSRIFPSSVLISLYFSSLPLITHHSSPSLLSSSSDQSLLLTDSSDKLNMWGYPGPFILTFRPRTRGQKAAGAVRHFPVPLNSLVVRRRTTFPTTL